MKYYIIIPLIILSLGLIPVQGTVQAQHMEIVGNIIDNTNIEFNFFNLSHLVPQSFVLDWTDAKRPYEFTYFLEDNATIMNITIPVTIPKNTVWMTFELYDYSHTFLLDSITVPVAENIKTNSNRFNFPFIDISGTIELIIEFWYVILTLIIVVVIMSYFRRGR